MALEVLIVGEKDCDVDSRLQHALSDIWLLPDQTVLQRGQGLMTKYDFEMEPGSHCPITRMMGEVDFKHR